MALKTLGPDTNSIADEHDKGHGAYKKQLEELSQLEKIRDNHPDVAEAQESLRLAKENEDVQKQEVSQVYPNTWNNNTGPQEPKQGKKSLGGLVKANKKKGLIAAFVSILLVGVFAVLTLSPTLLFIHIAETITQGMDMQGGSMNARTAKVYASMMKDTSGFCAGDISLRCKFRSMKDSHIEKLEKAGIRVVVDGNETITGRKRVTALEFGGKVITASSFSMEIKTNEKFRLAAQEAYNPWFARLWDKTADLGLKYLGTGKNNILQGTTTDEEKDAKIREVTKDGQGVGTPGVKYREEVNDDGTIRYYDANDDLIEGEAAIAEAAAHNAAVDRAGPITAIIGNVDESDTKLTPQILELLDDSLKNPDIDMKSVSVGMLGSGVLSATDSICTAYGLHNAVSYGAKAIRAAQMARYAMVFLNAASAAKAGELSPEDAAYIGGLLTMIVMEEVVDDNGKVSTRRTKAATDSFGYQYVAGFLDGKHEQPLTPSATEFLAGGGLGGKLTNLVDGIIDLIPGSKKANKEGIKDMCGIVKNPFVQAGSLALSVGLIFTGPIGWGALATSLGAGVVADLALSTLTAVLTPILTDMVAGVLIDDSTFGERTGDALVSGSGVIMTTLAGRGGNAPLRPEEAVAYMNGPQSEALALHREDDRNSRSPLDITSPNTFIGNIASQIIPISSKASSLTSIITSYSSITSRSLKSIVAPSASALTATAETYTQCDDEDYRRMNLATDPFCNPIRGIPSQYLEDDPIDIINRLMDIENGGANASIDDNGNPRTDTENGKRYQAFLKDCINREEPLGYSGEEFDQDDGSKCFIEDSDDDGNPDGETTMNKQLKADWYVFTIDQRILDGIENGYVVNSINCGPFGGSSGGSVGGKMSEAELKQNITSWGLPEPQAETSGEVRGYNDLLKQLQDDPKAAWAVQSLLNGEKKWKAAGGEIIEYLNTGWMWMENGQDSRPDPYQINCVETPSLSMPSEHCPVQNWQVAGYQAGDRAVTDDYLEVFEKLYSEDEMFSVLEGVLQNSSNASLEKWDYNHESQQAGLVLEFKNQISTAKTSDIARSLNDILGNRRTQFFTILLGKDPNMVAGLNSYAVTESDVVAMLRDCNAHSWSAGSSYYCNPDLRPRLANMIMALYMFDGQGPSGGANCGGAATGFGSGVGISAVWGGGPEVTMDDLGYGYKSVPTGGAQPGWYDYGKKHGLSGSEHTGTDIPMAAYAPVYSPVEGKVLCERNGVGQGVNEVGCAGSGDLSGTGGKCSSNGYDASKPKGAGTILIQITEGGNPTGEYLRLGHLSDSLVKVGDTVKPNQHVGAVGCMNGWHVHVEYFIPAPGETTSGLKLVDPVEYLGGGSGAS